MQIAILGARVIGSALARKWVAAGHHILFGVRDVGRPELKELVSRLGPQAGAGTVAEAIAFGEVVVFAIPGHAMEETVGAQAQALNGKLVIDATNKFGQPVLNSVAAFSRYVPTAKVYRAFNNLGWENFADPNFDGVQADLLYCGAADESRPVVERLIAEVGLRPVWVGGLERIRLVDTLGDLWFALAVGQKMGRHLAFKVLAP